MAGPGRSSFILKSGRSAVRRVIVDDMNAFIVGANIVLVALTLVVILYARATVKESQGATTAAETTVTKAGEIVNAVRDLLAVARETAATSEAATEASRQAVQASNELLVHARTTYEADERHRLRQQLLAIGGVVAAVISEAENARQLEAVAPSRVWQSPRQDLLGQLLAGTDFPLPKCPAVVAARRAPHEVLAMAYDARAEVTAALAASVSPGEQLLPALLPGR
jgi:hypothetical protein